MTFTTLGDVPLLVKNARLNCIGKRRHHAATELKKASAETDLADLSTALRLAPSF